MQDNRYTPQPRKYSKSNFVDLVELLTPEVYQREDLELSGTELNPLSEIINSNVAAAANISEILSISGVANSQTSTLGNISGISQYFVKQNNLTNITPFTLENKLLLPLGTTFSNFDSSADFNNYLSGTLLPLIIPATGSEFGGPKHNITTLSALTNNPEPSSVHNYLVDALGWFYFLNTSADGGLVYDPSSYVLSSFNTLYTGERLTTVDGIKGFTEYLWRNYQTCSTFRTTGTIPAPFVSSVSDDITETSAGVLPIYTSGIQRLDKLKTLIDVIYSPLFIDQQDFTVKDAFQNYIDASIVLNDRTSKGPTRKFNNLLGFQFADISNQMDEIGLIYDIENTKDEHLQYLAQMIGWKLRGISADGWRHQLRKATDLYKKSGTLEAIQTAVNLLIVDSVLDVSGQTMELWESYLPYMIWYALGTESDLFKNLTTWTFGLAQEAGVGSYSPSSLDDNLKSVTDYILLELYKRFPDAFQANGSPFPVPELYNIDLNGDLRERYAIVGEPLMPPFHGHIITEPGYESARRAAEDAGYGVPWRSSISMGPLGSGVYMKGLEHPNYAIGEVPEFLSATGDLQFLFTYRDKVNYAMPPFEEHKYYADCNLTPPLLSFLKDKLKCFQVNETFADNFESFVLSAGINTDTNLGSLNEFMMYFSSVQVAPNFDKMLLNISDYQRNLLDLWNGKSSHLFVDFNSDDFDFAKDTLEGDGKYALYEASRLTKEFSPAHAIPLINLNASAEDDTTTTGTRFSYLGLDNDMTRASYTSASILGNFSYSGVNMGAVAPGDTDGRGGLNTFTRNDVDRITDTLLSSTTGVADLNSVGRRALRRRNLRYLLPREGYYDRTGFNGPVSYDPSTLEYSMPSSLGELTLGYVASAGKFYPIVDPMTPSGVWDACEKLGSSRSFSGVATSATFPYRGLNALGSDARAITTSATARYVDRGQLPPIYNTMHQLFEDKALNYAAQETNFGSNDYLANNYWKDELQSFANSAIASGLVLNSFDDYINFSFGTGLQKTWGEHCEYFGSPLGRNDLGSTGGSVFAQVFGRGLFNCDFDLTGYAATTTAGSYVASSVSTSLPLSENNGSGVFSTCAVAAYSTGAALPASGSYIAKYPGQGVVPLSGTYILDNPNNAEFRNPNILSGIEFTNVSGSPIANQFGIFDIDPVFAVAGSENALIDNTVIKCKSLGGLPRLRFNLKDYGDRPNHFIKDHVFKLKVNALVGEENSYTMGGGRLGAWIHTEPEYSNNYFMWTSYNKAGGDASTENEGLARITGASTNLDPAFPEQVADIPPGFENKFLYEASGLSALEMTFKTTTTNTWTYIGAINTSANVSEDQEYVFSIYAKTRGYADATSGITVNMYENTGSPVSYYVGWAWGSDGIPYFTLRSSSKIKHRVQEVGNGWYRFSVAMTGQEMLDANANVEVGDNLRLIWYMGRAGSHGNIQGKKLRFWGPQMEVYDKGTNKALKNGVANPGPFKWVPKITQPEDPPRYIWSWTPNGKWEYMKESDVSIPKVLSLSHKYDFSTYDASLDTSPGATTCINNVLSQGEDVINDHTLLNIRDSYFETFEIDFDTRNFTQQNNSEYLQVIPIPEDIYKITQQVNTDSRNYVVELFFIPNSNPDKYLLIEDIQLQDVTQREQASIGTGYGIETSGIPNKRFVKEERLYLEENQLLDVLKFYNGLIGKGIGIYATNLASRDSTITSEVMDLSGGSRLNYRLSPSWGATNLSNTVANFNNFKRVELDN